MPTLSGSLNLSGSFTVTGSITSNGSTVITSNVTSSFTVNTSSLASTGSNAFTGTQTITGSLIVTGSVTISGSNTFINVGPMKTGVSNNVALNNSLAQGSYVSASGDYSHAEGYFSRAKADASHVEGSYSTAGLPAWDTNGTFNGLTQLPSFIGNITSSFTPGTVVALGTNYLIVSRSFFQSNLTQIQYVSSSTLNQSAGIPLAIIDVNNTLITYPNQTLKSGYGCHAEGNNNIALYGHAEGGNNVAMGSNSHAEGEFTVAIGYGSHAEGSGTIARGNYQHVEGLYNIEDSSSLLIVGNGSDPLYGGTRSDAFRVRMSGSIVLPTTQSTIPAWSGSNGEMVFATVGGNHRFYVWMAGAWRSGSLS